MAALALQSKLAQARYNIGDRNALDLLARRTILGTGRRHIAYGSASDMGIPGIRLAVPSEDHEIVRAKFDLHPCIMAHVGVRFAQREDG